MRKYKKNIMIVLVLVLFLHTVVFATFEDKLNNHWSKNEINKTFVAYYFPYLARNSFDGFDPNSSINQDSFSVSTASLFRSKGFEVPGLENTATLTRANMVTSLGTKLAGIGIPLKSGVTLPFKDVSTLDESTLNALKLLYDKGIIKGESNSIFNPNRPVTQAEAIIVLQRAEMIIESANNINFIVLEQTTSYNSIEEMTTQVSGDKVTVSITKQFPTPGYTYTVDKIMKEKDSYRIYFNIKEPAPGTMLPQVIVYQTIKLEIEKSELGNPPYSFVVEGFRQINN